MYRSIGQNVSRHPILWIVVWVLFAAIAIALSPPQEAVWQDGEMAFLPKESPSVRAVNTYREAFQPSLQEAAEKDSVGTSVQQDPLGSNVVIVLQREDRPSGLTPEDESFIKNVLVAELEKLQRTTPKGYNWKPGMEKVYTKDLPQNERVIKSIVTMADERIGPLLTSPDQKATLVILELTTEFLERQNRLLIGRLEQVVDSPELQDKKPIGLSLALSGSATVGRDMLLAEQQSASRTEFFTKLLVIVLLLAIYRAPLLALVPLVTVGVSVALSKALLRIMAGWGWIGLFTGLDVYVTVVVYGAGVDYCLFLIARYKEELDSGLSQKAALSNSIERVGAALATSAGTSIVGIGMMGFSEFGKFRQAGFAISFGLFVVLCFALTFTPAFLILFGKWAFWPDVRIREVGKQSGWLPSSTMWNKLRDQRVMQRFWEGTARTIQRWPGYVFVLTVLAMMPLAIIGILYQDNLSYGLLTDLPQDSPSVVGAKVVQKHYPAGITGPHTIFVEFPIEVLHEVFGDSDLKDARTSEKLSEAITQNLSNEDIRLKAERSTDPLEQPIGIEDVRSQYQPLGNNKKANEYLTKLPLRMRGAKRTFAHRTYTGLNGSLAGQVLRLDVVLSEDPFSRSAIQTLSKLEEAVRHSIFFAEDSDIPLDKQAKLRDTAKIYSLGTTAAIRDLKSVTDRDRILIDILVTVSVYLVIVTLLRQPEICAYLIVSVVFSYLITLGATFVFFYLRDPTGFNGIDWKVPVYLFTILIAMGEDYNILLMARVTEEQETYGKVGGVLQALMKTGGIISSCGIIMAGTFFTLMSGSLLAMVQMGFALGFGVLLDTFIVRPILVPSYLILLYSGRFGWFGRFLGAPAETFTPSEKEREYIKESIEY
ncbi:MMPL family transporter [Planctomicrobium piriforme]|uniref:Putative drug exporter of the RND superfamily n=1 Tax=Planctomicrobium piriforme TaxID=1576369 RepID=A0A1I3F452_9PLAN|nr:MMPL family transporter [Planctomicrobium piriforme]SFI05943.1 putative drug exporter of the RND superfamily [Planctomicrobium piriforme]